MVKKALCAVFCKLLRNFGVHCSQGDSRQMDIRTNVRRSADQKNRLTRRSVYEGQPLLIHQTIQHLRCLIVTGEVYRLD